MLKHFYEIFKFSKNILKSENLKTYLKNRTTLLAKGSDIVSILPDSVESGSSEMSGEIIVMFEASIVVAFYSHSVAILQLCDI